ncbi:MAG: polysaccharide deacetylase family protein [Oscillospiraceae bacterium]|nr:polysaccharide deacetylase family protein [Oscillospiraceae bacterium]
MIPVAGYSSLTNDSKDKYYAIIRYYSSLRVPGIMYHKITSDPNEWSVYSISPQTLREDFQTMKNLGYTPITLSEYAEILYGYSCLSNNTADIDYLYNLVTAHPKPILITADDGYLGIYTDFMPLLKEFGFKANFMIYGEVVDSNHPEYVSWEQITEMQQSGLVEFGNHTYSLHNYPNSDLIGLYFSQPEFCKNDIELNRAKLEAATGVPCTTFAYPYGIRNTFSSAIIDQCGYTKILNTDYRTNIIGSGIYNIARVNRDNTTTSQAFFARLSSLKATV